MCRACTGTVYWSAASTADTAFWNSATGNGTITVTQEPVWRRWTATFTGVTTAGTATVTFSDYDLHMNQAFYATPLDYARQHLAPYLRDVRWNGWVEESEEQKAERAAALERQRAAEDAALLRAREQQAVARERRLLADARAKRLLQSVLSPAQRRSYRRRGFFTVVSQTGLRFRIYRGRSHNVKLVNGRGRELVSYCIHDALGLVAEDAMIAHKLMLEVDESRFLRTANADVFGIAPASLTRYIEERRLRYIVTTQRAAGIIPLRQPTAPPVRDARGRFVRRAA